MQLTAADSQGGSAAFTSLRKAAKLNPILTTRQDDDHYTT
jgi:hypothetical protein